jgi:transitional endoplasmic reticulum ATPase
MSYEFAKNQLLGVCHKLLVLKEGKIEHNFCEITGFVIGPQRRETIICKILSDLVRLKKEHPSEHHIFLGKDTSDSDIKKLLRDCNWPELINHRNPERRKLAKQLQETFYKKSQIPEKSRKKFSEYYISERDFADAIESLIDISIFNGFGVRELLYKEVTGVLKEENYSEYIYPSHFKVIAKVFELNEIQMRLLYFYFLYETVQQFESFVSYTSLDFSERKKAPEAFSKLLNISQAKIKRELRSNSKLSQAMLLEIDDKNISLSDHICDFLQNDDEESDVFSFFFEKSEVNNAIDVDHHRLDDADISTLKNLIKCDQGVNLLLYGAPGTGKTEFTKSIGKKFGIDVYKIKTHDPDSSDLLKEKRSALMAAKNMLPKNSILVIDEAEEILGSGYSLFYRDTSDNKAWLNTFMEEHSVNVIWITNDLTMHPSTKRRFDYAICFESFSRTQRVEALKNIQTKLDLELFHSDELVTLANDYKLDPGVLNLAFKKMASLNDGRVNKKNLVVNLLNSQKKLITGKAMSEKKIEKFYDPDFVNVSIDQEEILHVIRSFYTGEKDVRNLCVLFQGVPGTGKTEYAKYISEALDKTLNVKRASDILTPSWGGTEKRIAEMFSEAQKDSDILFLDECDSLFKSRSAAEYSWMISETNELLTQMERFKGVLICATNFIEKLDQAAMRRFHIKVKFDDLLPTALPKVYEAFFKKLSSNLSDNEMNRLLSMRGLNPGDFKAVYNALIFKNSVTNDEILTRLKDELSYKKGTKPIGLTCGNK